MMKNKTHNKVLALLFTASLFTSFNSFAVGADLDKGIYELNRGSFKSAIAEFKPLAEEGYAPAQYQMAMMYKNGYGLPKDAVKVVELLTLAANQLNPDAQFELALLYTEGKFVKKDLKKAFQLTSKAAYKGLASAQFNLAVMYANGIGVKQDDFGASRWYKFSAEQNYSLAQYNLALLYSEGKGVEKSLELSYVWNTIASWNGYADAETSRRIDEREISNTQLGKEKALEKANKIYLEILTKQEKKAKLASKVTQ
jgi:TPR repeat protein